MLWKFTTLQALLLLLTYTAIWSDATGFIIMLPLMQLLINVAIMNYMRSDLEIRTFAITEPVDSRIRA